MTPEHTALVERLEGDVTLRDVNDAIAAIRALSGEVERLKGMDDAMIRLALCHDIKDALVKERDTLRAEVAALEKQVRLAAGMLSTTGRFADQHPEVALRYIQDSQAIDDAALADKQENPSANPNST